MAFFGLFSDKPTQKTIDKLVLRLKERYAQPEYRREAMDKLLEMATPEAYAAVMQRFTVVAQSPHWDEEEKRWLVDELGGRGDLARKAVLEFLGKHDHIAFAARALGKLTSSKDELLDGLHGALQARPADDHRTTHGKQELVAALSDLGDGRVVSWVTPYLADHADDVQVAAIDCIEKHIEAAPADAQGEARTRIAAIVADDARSARVLRHAAAAMSRRAIPVDATRPIAPAVAEDFAIKDGVLVASR